ncbi:MAG: HEPN domain-containing protein [Nitrososphaeraceae archaeon]
MAITFSNALVDAAQSDYDVANILSKNGYYSHSIYHFQQSFEKSIKALYSHYRTKYEKIDEKSIYIEVESYGHDTKKSSFDLLIMVSREQPKYLLKQIPDYVKRKPDSRILISRLFEIRSTFVQSLEALKMESIINSHILLKRYPKSVENNYNKFKASNSRIQPLTSKFISQSGFSINRLSDETNTFFQLLISSRSLYPCLAQMESITRYPLERFQYKNISILNSKDMHIVCKRINEMILAVINAATKIVKT